MQQLVTEKTEETGGLSFFMADGRVNWFMGKSQKLNNLYFK